MLCFKISAGFILLDVKVKVGGVLWQHFVLSSIPYDLETHALAKFGPVWRLVIKELYLVVGVPEVKDKELQVVGGVESVLGVVHYVAVLFLSPH